MQIPATESAVKNDARVALRLWSQLGGTDAEYAVRRACQIPTLPPPRLTLGCKCPGRHSSPDSCPLLQAHPGWMLVFRVDSNVCPPREKGY